MTDDTRRAAAIYDKLRYAVADNGITGSEDMAYRMKDIAVIADARKRKRKRSVDSNGRRRGGGKMNGKELSYVRDTIEQEGFAYAFTGYSDFAEIKDKEFHALRMAYVEAAEKLADYLGIEQ